MWRIQWWYFGKLFDEWVKASVGVKSSISIMSQKRICNSEVEKLFQNLFRDFQPLCCPLYHVQCQLQQWKNMKYGISGYLHKSHPQRLFQFLLSTRSKIWSVTSWKMTWERCRNESHVNSSLQRQVPRDTHPHVFAYWTQKKGQKNSILHVFFLSRGMLESHVCSLVLHSMKESGENCRFLKCASVVS